mgnify:CR=1 FL=1
MFTIYTVIYDLLYIALLVYLNHTHLCTRMLTMLFTNRCLTSIGFITYSLCVFDNKALQWHGSTNSIKLIQRKGPDSEKGGWCQRKGADVRERGLMSDTTISLLHIVMFFKFKHLCFPTRSFSFWVLCSRRLYTGYLTFTYWDTYRSLHELSCNTYFYEMSSVNITKPDCWLLTPKHWAACLPLYT